jgi:lysine 2,3-aminomutase
MMSNLAIRTARGLADAGAIAPDAVAPLDAVAQRYAVAVTPALLALIDPDDPTDPIRRQFVPDVRELIETPDESADPIGDEKHSPVPGVVHRYPDRVLLKVTHACPVYCRFCFRREMVGPGGDGLTGAALDVAIAYIAERPAPHRGPDPAPRRDRACAGASLAYARARGRPGTRDG